MVMKQKGQFCTKLHNCSHNVLRNYYVILPFNLGRIPERRYRMEIHRFWIGSSTMYRPHRKSGKFFSQPTQS